MRDIERIVCSCGGKVVRVDCTKKEMELYNCGRDYECCAQSWECQKCKVRWAFELEAPEFGMRDH